jgi:hypothetical protein
MTLFILQRFGETLGLGSSRRIRYVKWLDAFSPRIRLTTLNPLDKVEPRPQKIISGVYVRPTTLVRQGGRVGVI